ncbi:MAG: class II fumarate hydratase, partial [Acidobacteriota bacterium]
MSTDPEMPTDSNEHATRTETDSLGEIQVPASAYYGAQTERAVRNFPISGLRFPHRFIAAHALIKREAAKVNRDLDIISPEIADAIVQAADEVIDGEHLDQFPIDIFQTGSGTSTNMNVNEVISNRAIEILGGEVGSKTPVHPNDHVNAGQSSNDTIPTSIHLAAYGALIEQLEPALDRLGDALDERAEAFDEVVKIGRTHLQDAVPVRLGQEFGGYAQQIRNGRHRLEAVKPRLAELALGGTAVGTGLNAPPDFATRVIAGMASSTGYPYIGAPNRFEALAAKDAAVETSGALRTIAVSLTKVANDIRWLGSGPRCGIGELNLPAIQPGSSIMPGKVNPVICESVMQVVCRVLGNDATVTAAGLGGVGSIFELNVAMPVMIDAFLESVDLLANVSDVFVDKLLVGLEVNEDRCAELLDASLMTITALAPEIGYDKCA